MERQEVKGVLGFKSKPKARSTNLKEFSCYSDSDLDEIKAMNQHLSEEDYQRVLEAIQLPTIEEAQESDELLNGEE